MKPLSPDNFARFIVLHPEYRADIMHIRKIVNTIEDAELQAKILARINVELGVVLLGNQEIGNLLDGLFLKAIKDQVDPTEDTLLP